MTNIERLNEKLLELGVTNFSFTRGSDESSTGEAVAQSILNSLEAVEKGDFEVIKDVN